MPLIRSAIKKMRQDHKKTLVNRTKKENLKKTLKLASVKPTTENVSKAFSALDKAVKIGLIPKGRADRKKSRLPKISSVSQKTKPTKVVTQSKKTSAKKA